MKNGNTQSFLLSAHRKMAQAAIFLLQKISATEQQAMDPKTIIKSDREKKNKK